MHRSCIDHQCNNPSRSNRFWGTTRKNNVLFQVNCKSECKRVFLVQSSLKNSQAIPVKYTIWSTATSLVQHGDNMGARPHPSSSAVIYSSNLQHNNVLDTHRSLKRPESTILPKFQYMLTKRVQFCSHRA